MCNIVGRLHFDVPWPDLPTTTCRQGTRRTAFWGSFPVRLCDSTQTIFFSGPPTLRQSEMRSFGQSFWVFAIAFSQARRWFIIECAPISAETQHVTPYQAMPGPMLSFHGLQTHCSPRWSPHVGSIPLKSELPNLDYGHSKSSCSHQLVIVAVFPDRQPSNMKNVDCREKKSAQDTYSRSHNCFGPVDSRVVSSFECQGRPRNGTSRERSWG